jgi:hypothetical protein
MKMKLFFTLLSLVVLVLVGCGGNSTPEATPTIDPAIFNQVPDTTVFEPGQCTAVIEATAPAFTSNTLGGTSSGEIPPGEYEVGIAADYGSSVWYALNGIDGPNYVNSTSVSSLEGDCSTGN